MSLDMYLGMQGEAVLLGAEGAGSLIERVSVP
jgi:hypothetical protein